MRIDPKACLATMAMVVAGAAGACALGDPDVRAIVAYLKSIPAVDNATPGPTAVADAKTPYFVLAGP